MNFGNIKYSCTEWLLITSLLFIQPVASSLVSEEWDQRPGTVHVCSGDKALFLWNYNQSLGIFESVHFLRSPPNWQVLFEKHLKEEPKRRMERVHLVPNSTYGFTLDNVSLSDSGTYEIQIFLENPKMLFDLVDLSVIESKACPNKLKYRHPDMFITELPGHNKPVENNTQIELSMPGSIVLLVVIPAADPPVNSTITLAKYQYNCRGTSERDSVCKQRLFFEDYRNQNISVTLGFVAFQQSTTIFYVKKKDNSVTRQYRDTPMSRNALSGKTTHAFLIEKRPQHTAISTATITVVLASVIVVLLVFWLNWIRKRRAKLKYPHAKDFQTFGNNEEERLEKVKRLFNDDNTRPSSLGLSALSADAIAGFTSVVQFHLDQGADVNRPESDSSTPLHYAAIGGQLEVVKLLCSAGADQSLLDHHGRTPLGASAQNGYISVGEYLIKQGADVNYPGSVGFPPLHCAAMGGHVDMMEYLCSQGAKLQLLDKHGRSPLEAASQKQQNQVIEHFKHIA